MIRTQITNNKCFSNQLNTISIHFPLFAGQYREDGSQSFEVIQTISSGIESLEPSILKNILGVNDSKRLQDSKDITCSHGSQQPGEKRRIDKYIRKCST